MDNVQWLLANGSIPMKYNLYKRLGDADKCRELTPALLACAETEYWMGHLMKSLQNGNIANIHGSHDYRYENFMGKLVQVGLNSDIEEFGELAAMYINFLSSNIAKPREDTLSFGKLYSYYEYELMIAAFLAMAGYSNYPEILYVAEKRLNLLYNFTRRKSYDIYVDSAKFHGVKKEWQGLVINPALYESGNITLPTIHDIALLGAVFGGCTDEGVRDKLKCIVLWHFNQGCTSLPVRYGYFYAPGGSYTAKAICWRLQLPDIGIAAESMASANALLHKVLLLSKFEAARGTQWYTNALSWLAQFRNNEGRYRLPDIMLTERKDSYWILGGHMGMAEDRRKNGWQEVLSTYWMSNINVDLIK